MSTKFSLGKMQFDVSLQAATDAKPLDPEAPFCLGILGDFSGRAGQPRHEPLAQRRIRQLDVDNWAEVMSQLGARLTLDFAQGPAIETAFASLEDFHPDRLVQHIAPLAKLCDQRRNLLAPATAAAAERELQDLLSAPPQPPTAAAKAEAPASESEAATLARLLGGAPAKPTPAPRSGVLGAVDSLLRTAVGPSVAPGASAGQAALLSVLDLELGRQLRSVLHHPRFQALEAAWRGVDLLVRNFGAEENLKVFIFDVSKEELQADLKAQATLDGSDLWKALRRHHEDLRWAVWCGLYAFEDSVADLETLGGLAKMAARLSAPFLAEASPHLAGCDSFEVHPDPDEWKRRIAPEIQAEWRALRELSEASYLGLVLPRFLLRQPYGKDSDPIEAFPFQELEPDSPHDSYLWGNPAVVCAHLLACAFQDEGWAMRPCGPGELSGLPVYKFREGDETKVKPCAEAWLHSRAIERLTASGLMPLASIKGRDAVRLVELQSVRSPSGPLAGPWG